ncbi:hypothetical protein CAOG_07548 [Capsaspora owczarzaki ATCC 30864]|uniref:Amidase domain-containing protein n=1 Tax=Capsaspora owczarzaki (strain ATCC 30864) TaxID=595528 RepID=A0A0D2UQ09_CAPO3|nr:hypothetical protein CAOG_07548 [Capsaspora owczarzaki ATCC 30864]KJE97076.1 hypothetical protein CAOG_007548 [Capsaspora owczarzaki ATCC 30864]|eukprot:XP_004343422.2 hypothetical protein CAOG_07548 [Capsaspora owczarzaki ATCC 30864]
MLSAAATAAAKIKQTPVAAAISAAAAIAAICTTVATSYHRNKLEADAERRHAYMRGICQRKRAERDARRLVPFECNVDPELQALIISLPVHELVQGIQSHRFTSEQIVRTYCQRAKLCGERFNSNAEEFFHEAIEEAKEADAYFASTGQLKGPLHGIPISVKDQFDQKGADSTCGMAAKCFHPSAEDGLLVHLIRTAGGIPFVRSNVPQMLMVTETRNDIWGTALNPYNTSRVAGGSSGGEGVLLACAASPLGLGTDVGGSIRVPSNWCGIYGFKPTPQRMSTVGLTNGMSPQYGQQAILPVAGPMGRCVEDLTIIMKCWWVDALWNRDPYVPRMPFNDAIYRFAAMPKATTAQSAVPALPFVTCGPLLAATCAMTPSSLSSASSIAPSREDDEREKSPYPSMAIDVESGARSRTSSLNCGSAFGSLAAAGGFNLTDPSPRPRSSSIPHIGSSLFGGASAGMLLARPAAEVPTPLRPRKLRIGYFTTTALFESSPACARAVQEVVASLTEAGHELVFFEPPNLQDGAMTLMGLLSCDRGLEAYIRGLQGEALNDAYEPLYQGSIMSTAARTELADSAERQGMWRLAGLVRATGVKNAFEYKEYIHKAKTYKNAFVHAWQAANLDALICPTMPLPALPHLTTARLIPAHCYANLFNLLHVPAGSVPVTHVRADEQCYTSVHRDAFTDLAVEASAGTAGLPVGVQVVALPFQDELCLHVMGLIERTNGLHEHVSLTADQA